MRRLWKAVLGVGLILAGILVAASPAAATTSHASNDYPYCVLQVQDEAHKYSNRNDATCYSTYAYYTNALDNYNYLIATLFGGTNYSGWRLGLVADHQCVAPDYTDYPKYVSQLDGTGFNNAVSSSKMWIDNCTGGLAYDNDNYVSQFNMNFGHPDSIPDWSAYGASNAAQSLYIDHATIVIVGP